MFMIKWILATIALILSLFVAHAVAWADIFFWKVGWIARIIAIPESILLFPTTVIPIAPGSALDTPWFFLPACVLNIAMWSLVIVWIWSKGTKAKLANTASHGTALPRRP